MHHLAEAKPFTLEGGAAEEPSYGPILARHLRYEAYEECSSRLQDTRDLLEHQSPVPQKSKWEEVASPVTCASAPVEPQELTLTHVSLKEEVLNQELQPPPHHG